MSKSGPIQGTVVVAPCMGAWIEIPEIRCKASLLAVAPCMGAWIEIRLRICHYRHPCRVAPCMGAWIEIGGGEGEGKSKKCRTLYGCVD